MMFSSPVAEMSRSTIRPLTRCSRLMYSSSSMFGQKFTSWMLLVGRADPVDAAEALDDADRVPVDVVVDEVVAVLEVLALGDAVGGDEQIEFALARQAPRGVPSSAGEKAVRMLARSLRRPGSVVWFLPGAGDQGRVQAEFFLAHGASCS